MVFSHVESTGDLRQRAEEHFNIHEHADQKNLSSVENERLLHELQVHQIELEMQNEELQRTQSELDAVRDRYFELYDLAPVGYLTLNKQGMIKEANLAIATMLHVSRQMLLGLALTRFIHNEDQDIYYQHRNQCVGTTDPHSLEMRMLRSDGSLFWAFLQANSARNGEYWVTLNDITARKDMERKLNESMLGVERANKAKSEFLSNMSHEIRTPMNGIIGMAQLLAMSELTENQREHVDLLVGAGANLLSLINDILDLSKIEAGKITLDVSEFNLQNCIHNVVKMQKEQIRSKGLSVTCDVDNTIPAALLGDQLRIKQILTNIVGNAIKFTMRGGITITAKPVERQDSSVLVQIALTDTGIGISEESRESIFQAFVQEDGSTSRRFGGTGLGLSICRSLVELMEGSITVESRLGIGTCFKVTIPFALCKNSSTAEKATTPQKAVWDGPPLRILFVEDNQLNVTFGVSLLNKFGFSVVTALDGRECLAELEQDIFDLVLMDIEMPIMNGDEVIKIIRNKEQGTAIHLPVIALTAYSLRGEKERFLQEGFDGYVSKPMEIEVLLSEMKRVITSASVMTSL